MQHICGIHKEDVAHAPYNCSDARNLWEATRMLWCLPSHGDLHDPTFWFQSVILNSPIHMCLMPYFWSHGELGMHGT